MSIKRSGFFKHVVYLVVRWGRRHIIIVCGCALGFFAGFGGILVGFLTSFFIETLITRMSDDKALEDRLEKLCSVASSTDEGTDARNTFLEDEPFDGALLVCALAVYCIGNPDFAGQQMKTCFGHRYKADWASLCRIATRSESLNGDLITECLAARFAKNKNINSKYADDYLLQEVFAFLSAVQYNWNYDRGEKPSVYLSELLHEPLLQNKKEVDKATAACRMLGVSITDSAESIKAAHRRLVALYHPDTLGNLSIEQQEIAAETFLRIQVAYEDILHP